MRTYLIVPAMTDMATQCRIVSREGSFITPLCSYRNDPAAWAESGVMNSDGRVVCLDNSALFHQMRADEPLAAGYTYVV